ncbi:hypothetical protein QP185_07590 [Sphingomonas aerolata]|uniref:hypothetical protein n=1 Tax=Sphingomonas aerolata TaxID=185951 RepID=UPI002FE174A4
MSRALIAPWVLHAGLGSDAPASALLGKVILASLDAAGMRFVEGGWDKHVDAFTRIVEAGGGEVVTGAEVTAVEALAVAGFGS